MRKNRLTAPRLTSRAPVERPRERLRMLESRATSTGSGARERRVDRSAAVGWSSRTTSSASSPVSRRCPANSSRRFHSWERRATSASTSTRATLPYMSEPVAPKNRAVHAFPRPQGEDIPERIYETDQVITGEAVALKIQPASPVQLIAAGMIDLFLSIGVAMAALVFLSMVGSLDHEAATTYVILALVLAVVLIPATVETVTQGRSLGRWALGVQIVGDDGGAIRLRYAIGTRSFPPSAAWSRST